MKDKKLLRALIALLFVIGAIGYLVVKEYIFALLFAVFALLFLISLFHDSTSNSHNHQLDDMEKNL